MWRILDVITKVLELSVYIKESKGYKKVATNLSELSLHDRGRVCRHGPGGFVSVSYARYELVFYASAKTQSKFTLGRSRNLTTVF